MRKKIPALLWLIIVTAVLTGAVGVFLKYMLLRPMGLYQEEWAIAVPFLLLTEEGERDLLMMSLPEEEEPYTQPPEKEPAETEPLATEEPGTEPPYTEPLETESPYTEPAEEEPTESPYTEPVETEPPETEPVEIDESWFDDALFIGDSRTEGLAIYARLGDAEYFCKAGMTVYNVFSAECGDEEYDETNLEDLLSDRSYGKIYINLGLNEVGYDHGRVLEKYSDLIDLIRDKQPDAVVILQGIMTVSREKAASKEYFALEHIQALNDGIAELADGERVRYIDVNEWIADEDGYLPDDLSNDGCHLKGDGYADWSEWLMENAATLGI